MKTVLYSIFLHTCCLVYCGNKLSSGTYEPFQQQAGTTIPEAIHIIEKDITNYLESINYDTITTHNALRKHALTQFKIALEDPEKIPSLHEFIAHPKVRANEDLKQQLAEAAKNCIKEFVQAKSNELNLSDHK